MQTAPLRATISSFPSALQLQVLIWPWTGEEELKVEASPVQLVVLAWSSLSKKSIALLPAVVTANWPLAELHVSEAIPARHQLAFRGSSANDCRAREQLKRQVLCQKLTPVILGQANRADGVWPSCELRVSPRVPWWYALACWASSLSSARYTVRAW